jgi:hypothetical protein
MSQSKDDDPVAPRTPGYFMEDADVEEMDVEYSDRGPGDWVLSGPLGVLGGGPGRRFATIAQAEAHVRRLHGDRVVRRIMEATTNGSNRWAWLIRRKK